MVVGGGAMLPLYLLFLQLLYFSSPSSSSSSSSDRIDPSVLGEDRGRGPVPTFDRNISRCIPEQFQYPFGFVGWNQNRPGFEIYCNPSTGYSPMLRLGSENVPIKDVSLVDGYVRVIVRPIVFRASHRNWAESQIPADRNQISLDGTPYTFSEVRNKLTVIGCGALARIRSLDVSINERGCAAVCPSLSSVVDGSCAGVGCCQSPIPPRLKSFEVDFISIRNITGAQLDRRSPLPKSKLFENFTGPLDNYGAFSKAFILEDDEFVFSSDSLNDSYNDTHSVVLDWSIGSEPCSSARNLTSYACMADKSFCYDPKGVVGYRCNCSDGYSGNPYVPDGCQDVNECTDQATNPCLYKCKNTDGGYECSCRFGHRGDGKIHGDGCKGKVSALDVALGAGLCFLMILFLVCFWSYWTFKQIRFARLKQKYFLQNGGLLLQQHINSNVVTPRIFSAKELEKATDGFKDDRVLGHGGYGTVYRGILSDGIVVAIKKSKLVDESQIDQFINEVFILSQINHKNVVRLLGCCLETQVPLLVYEFISNGTLFHHVRAHADRPMSWGTRLQIAVETAAALAYLHCVASTPIIHRDVKSANILLDDTYTAKVSDFGASRLVPHDRTHVTTLVQGTLGYLDPEYFHTSLLTEKSDVYSFGVVLVELLTRENPISFCRSDNERSLAAYFVSLVEGNRLVEGIDRQTVEDAGMKHLSAVSQLAKNCLSLKGEDRPTMKEVAIELEALRRLMNQHFVEDG